MQTHLTSRTLKSDEAVQALLATDPSRKAVLFIHGFSGDAIKTWSYFHLLLPYTAVCKGHDLFFYGYDGLRADLLASAGIFRAFLCRLMENTGQIVDENLPPSAKRPNNFQYDGLVIVGHSLGAVIARRALLDCTKQQLPWVSKTSLVLYAPAHKGASIVQLALQAASPFPFLNFFAAGLSFFSPLIEQLKPGSPILTTLQQETLEARKEGANPHLVAKKVIIAEYEKVVTNETFGDDPPPDAIPKTTHTTVCKPRLSFLDPLTLLEKCL
jgi:pimeloyl-ACP methyl ester carboxylesterase